LIDCCFLNVLFLVCLLCYLINDTQQQNQTSLVIEVVVMILKTTRLESDNVVYWRHTNKSHGG